jgi:hypothetical protein
VSYNPERAAGPSSSISDGGAVARFAPRRAAQGGAGVAGHLPRGAARAACELPAIRRTGPRFSRRRPRLVLPLTIDQSFAHNMLPVPWGVRVRVRLGEPIPRRGEDPDEILRCVRGEMQTTLARWRGESPRAVSSAV